MNSETLNNANSENTCHIRADVCPTTKVTLTMCDGEAFALHLPSVMMNRWPEGSNIPAEIRCYLQDGFGAQTGDGQMTYYPASSIVKITVEMGPRP